MDFQEKMIDLANPKTDVKELWKNFILTMERHDVFWDGHGRFLFDVLTVEGWLVFRDGYVYTNQKLRENAELIIEAWVLGGILERGTNCYYAVDNQYVGEVLVRNGMIQRGNSVR
jgi:hypothetical protein